MTTDNSNNNGSPEGAVYSANLGITSQARQEQAAHNDMDETKFMQTTINGDGTVSYEISEGPEIGSTAQPSGNYLPTYDAAYMAPMASAQAQPHDIVDVPNVGRMTVQSALAGGFAVQTENGLVLPGGAARGGADNTQQEQQPEVEADQKSKELLDDPEPLANSTDEQLLNSVLMDTDPGTQVAAVNEVAAAGEISQNTINALASQMHVEPEQVQGIIEENIRPAFQQQARRAFTKATGIADSEDGGPVLDGMVEWLYANKPAEMNAAIKQQLMSRSTAAYAPLAKDALANYDRVDPEGVIDLVRDSGGKAHLSDKGEVVVTMKAGEQMTWSSAVRAGVISFT